MKYFKKSLPYLYIVAGLIAFYYSFLITVEKFNLIEDPSLVLPCDVSPFISCSSVMSSAQASVFGFPNPLIGIGGFAIVFTIGFALLAGARFQKWFWRGAQAGMFFAIVFIYWLAYQSIFNLGNLCPYCMYVWATTIPLFWFTTVHNIREGHILTSVKGLQIGMKNWHAWGILLLMYAVIVAAIIYKFWYNWLILFGLL